MKEYDVIVIGSGVGLNIVFKELWGGPQSRPHGQGKPGPACV